MREIRSARLDGLLDDLNSTEFFVLVLMADTCRNDSNVARISMTELSKLTGLDRSTMWRAVNKLIDGGYIERLSRGNQYQSAGYKILFGAHVALTQHTPIRVHVASAPQCRCADRTFRSTVQHRHRG